MYDDTITKVMFDPQESFMSSSSFIVASLLFL